MNMERRSPGAFDLYIEDLKSAIQRLCGRDQFEKVAQASRPWNHAQDARATSN